MPREVGNSGRLPIVDYDPDVGGIRPEVVVRETTITGVDLEGRIPTEDPTSVSLLRQILLETRRVARLLEAFTGESVSVEDVS